jgi:hypothetical protein
MTRRLEQWQIDMINAVPADVMRDIRGDAKAHNVILSRGGTATTNKEPPRGTGWQEAKSIDSWRPPGEAAMNRLMDEADALDKAERIARLVETARHLQLLKEAEAEAKNLEEKDPGK